MEQQLNAYMNQYEQLIKTIEDTNNKLNNTAQNQQNNGTNMLLQSEFEATYRRDVYL